MVIYLLLLIIAVCRQFFGMLFNHLLSCLSSMAQSNMTTAFKPMEEVRQTSVLFTDAAHNKELLAVFASLREQEELCDVTLCLGNARISAHRIVLAGSSPYFRAMFTSE